MYRLTDTALSYLRERIREHREQYPRSTRGLTTAKFCPVCNGTTEQAPHKTLRYKLGINDSDIHSACLACGWVHKTDLITDKGLRTQVFEADDYECVYCGARDQLAIDHVIPQARGGSHDFDNLVTACTFCNNRRGAARVEMQPQYGRFRER